MPRRKKERNDDEDPSFMENAVSVWDPELGCTRTYAAPAPTSSNGSDASSSTGNNASYTITLQEQQNTAAASFSSTPAVEGNAAFNLTFIQEEDDGAEDDPANAVLDDKGTARADIHSEYFDHLLGTSPSCSRVYGDAHSRLQVFAVMDFDPQLQRLVRGSCVFVWVAALEFRDACVVTTMCSCTPRDAYLLKQVKSGVTQIPLFTMQYFNRDPNCGCQHAKAVVQMAAFDVGLRSQQYAECLDYLCGHFDVVPDPVSQRTVVIPTSLQHPRFGELYAIWGEDGDIASAYIDENQRYRCLSCRRVTGKYCGHVSGLPKVS